MAQAKADKPNVLSRLTRYFIDVRGEMRRVVWPDRTEVRNSSLIVVVALVVLTIFVGLVDVSAQRLLLGLRNLAGR